MRIAIVGAGVMGRLWAGALIPGGHDVTVIDTDLDVEASLREDGVSVCDLDGRPRHVSVIAGSSADELTSHDVVFFFVKSAATAAAARGARSLVGPDTSVVTVQNGWGNAQHLAEVFDPAQVVFGITYQGGELRTDGTVVHVHEGKTIIGPYVDGGPLHFAERVSGALNAAGFETVVTTEVKTAVWGKLVFGAAVFPVAAITGLTAGELVSSPAFAVVRAIIAEAAAEAAAQGCKLDAAEQVTRIEAGLAAVPHARPSMLQDIEAGRHTEVDYITGAIARLARERGATAPVSETVTALVHGREKNRAGRPEVAPTIPPSAGSGLTAAITPNET
jgi:2-dehydropantoate 2-reductase